MGFWLSAFATPWYLPATFFEFFLLSLIDLVEIHISIPVNNPKSPILDTNSNHFDDMAPSSERYEGVSLKGA